MSRPDRSAEAAPTLPPAVEVRVHPTLIPKDHVLAHVGGPFNAVAVRGDVVGDTMFYGRGAGADATSSAVIADLADAALNLKFGSKQRVPAFVSHRLNARVRTIDKVESRYYLRLTVEDRSGVIAKISTVLGNADISVASVLQREAPEPKPGQPPSDHDVTHRARPRRPRRGCRDRPAARGERQDRRYPRGEFRVRRSVPAMVGLVLAGSAVALPVKIVVNGREIETSVIESNGVIYVPIETLGKALGATVTVKSSEVVAPGVVAAVPPAGRSPTAGEGPAAPAPAPETGATTTAPPPPKPAKPTTTVLLSTPPARAPARQSIRGELKYNLNILDSRGIDAGAQVWLVPATQVAALAAATGGTTDEPISQRSDGWDAKLTEQFQFPRAVADERGEFAFTDVAPGAYTLVLLSKHTNGLAARDREGKCRFKRLQVRDGETVDASFNFGMTAYKD